MLENSAKNQPLEKNTRVVVLPHQTSLFWKTFLRRLWQSINWLMVFVPVLAAIGFAGTYWRLVIVFALAPLPFLIALHACKAGHHHTRKRLAAAVVINVAGAICFGLSTVGALLAFGGHIALLFIVLAVVATVNAVVCMWTLFRHEPRDASQ